ncbi:class I SAM-dependent methyltransferase [Photobacterium damselae]|uniref:class I SAM-dependent methyltransferase n=1 Tax=Photobacterium damselae TaxID=38293 RepID=UPI001F43B61A|nr:class I SAM-dependent methyltransferase [Photobacterium damselae]UKA08991.1 class I SAM-dependent methyltransferase [Photobacterium damselae subsp. damselae]
MKSKTNIQTPPITITSKECNIILNSSSSQQTQSQPVIYYATLDVKNSKVTPLESTNFQSSDITVIVGGLSFLFGIWKYSSEKKNARTKAEIDKIQERIRTLYGPLKELREESKMLYDIFAIELKDSYVKSNGEHFRTLTYLRENKITTLKPYDQEILKQIIDISRKNIEFIEDNGWAIDSSALSTLLGNLCAHFRTMEIAAEDKMLGASDKLKDIVFPLETDGAIDNEIKKAQAQINNLQQKEFIFTYWLKKMVNTMTKCKTIKYYNKNADAYYMATNNIDMSESYKIFREYLPRGARILDAGCGVGRDTRFFISKGYKVQSFDKSQRMCEITRKYPFAFCEQMSFLDVDFYEEFDAIWANASLLHVPPKHLAEALTRLVRALKIDGFLFSSFKTQENYKKKDEREFYFYTKDDLDKIIEDNKLNLKLVKSWKSYKDNDSSKECFESYIWKRIN